MAAPNVAATTSLLGETTQLALADTSATTLLSNTASSNKLYKVVFVRATNVDGSNSVEVTLTKNTEDDGGGTAYALASGIAVPAGAAIDLITERSPLYLQEDTSLVVTAGAGNGLEIVCSYQIYDDA